MDDRQVALLEYTVSECACWVFVRLSGHRVIRADGADQEAYTPVVRAREE